MGEVAQVKLRVVTVAGQKGVVPVGIVVGPRCIHGHRVGAGCGGARRVDANLNEDRAQSAQVQRLSVQGVRFCEGSGASTELLCCV